MFTEGNLNQPIKDPYLSNNSSAPSSALSKKNLPTVSVPPELVNRNIDVGPADANKAVKGAVPSAPPAPAVAGNAPALPATPIELWNASAIQSPLLAVAKPLLQPPATVRPAEAPFTPRSPTIAPADSPPSAKQPAPAQAPSEPPLQAAQKEKPDVMHEAAEENQEVVFEMVETLESGQADFDRPPDAPSSFARTTTPNAPRSTTAEKGTSETTWAKDIQEEKNLLAALFPELAEARSSPPFTANKALPQQEKSAASPQQEKPTPLPAQVAQSRLASTRREPESFVPLSANWTEIAEHPLSSPPHFAPPSATPPITTSGTPQPPATPPSPAPPPVSFAPFLAAQHIPVTPPSQPFAPLIPGPAPASPAPSTTPAPSGMPGAPIAAGSAPLPSSSSLPYTNPFIALPNEKEARATKKKKAESEIGEWEEDDDQDDTNNSG